MFIFQGVSTTVDGKTTATNLSPMSQRLAEKLLELTFQLGVKVSKNISSHFAILPRNSHIICE